MLEKKSTVVGYCGSRVRDSLDVFFEDIQLLLLLSYFKIQLKTLPESSQTIFNIRRLTIQSSVTDDTRATA